MKYIRKIAGIPLFGILLALLTGVPSSYGADRILVDDATGSGVGTELLLSLTELVRTAVSANGGVLEEDLNEADYVLRPKLLKLGGSYVVTVEQVSDAKVLYSSQFKASKIEELDHAANRATRATMMEVNPGADARVGELTEREESEGTRRRRARKGYYLGFGPWEGTNTGSSGIGLFGTGAYSWDVNAAMVSAFLELAGSSGDSYFFDAGLSGRYFFSDQNTTPYAEAAFGYGSLRAGDGDLAVQSGVVTDGFVLGLGGGFQFLRTSSINLDISLQGRAILKSNSGGTPMIWVLRVGLFFP